MQDECRNTCSLPNSDVTIRIPKIHDDDLVYTNDIALATGDSTRFCKTCNIGMLNTCGLWCANCTCTLCLSCASAHDAMILPKASCGSAVRISIVSDTESLAIRLVKSTVAEHTCASSSSNQILGYTTALVNSVCTVGRACTSARDTVDVAVKSVWCCLDLECDFKICSLCLTNAYNSASSSSSSSSLSHIMLAAITSIKKDQGARALTAFHNLESVTVLSDTLNAQRERYVIGRSHIQAGHRGLFARVSIKRGTRLKYLAYNGLTLSDDEYDSVYASWPTRFDTGIQLPSLKRYGGLCIVADKELAWAAYINDYRGSRAGRPNCRFAFDERRIRIESPRRAHVLPGAVYVRATEHIAAGDELYLDYGVGVLDAFINGSGGDGSLN